MDEEVAKLFNIDDPFLIYLMNELEHADDMLYNENLSAANYIHWQSRKQTLTELRDKYCEGRK